MKFKLDFGVFGKISKGVAMAMELKQYLALYESLKTLIPLAMECKKAAEIPCKNFLIELKKKTAEARKVAAGTENKADDLVMDFIDGLADKLLEVFHCADDYEKLSAMDEAVKPVPGNNPH